VVHRKARNVNPSLGHSSSSEPLSTAQKTAASRENSNDDSDNRPPGSVVRYPDDLYGFGGRTIQNAQSHAIFLLPNGHCPIAQCWGNPEGFLADLGKSDFIHVADQYVGASANGRYTVGQGYIVPFAPQAKPFVDADMEALVHAAAKLSGQAGYGHIYHIFLPQGTDECFDSTYTMCYAPPATNTNFVFCAYHSSVTFADVGHLLYTVEPYQNVTGCNVRPGTPNGQLADSTNDVLNHETFETITDPDGDAWWNFLGSAAFGDEIGDECVFLKWNSAQTAVWSDPSLFIANGHLYATQPMYNNNAHACNQTP
jgi:hypothetical protein